MLLSALALSLVAGAALLGVYVGDWVRGLFLTAFTAYVVFGEALPLIWLLGDAGSIRQARRSLKEARREGRAGASLAARLRIALIRWQRRQ